MQDVRYSPSGEHFASVGSDSKVFVYNGTTGETLKEFTTGGHTGTIVRSWILLIFYLLICSVDGM